MSNADISGGEQQSDRPQSETDVDRESRQFQAAVTESAGNPQPFITRVSDPPREVQALQFTEVDLLMRISKQLEEQTHIMREVLRIIQ